MNVEKMLELMCASDDSDVVSVLSGILDHIKANLIAGAPMTEFSIESLFAIRVEQLLWKFNQMGESCLTE